MAGRFDGLSDSQWHVIAPLIPKPEYRTGRPGPDSRKVLNSILYVLITGCRWCDIPLGSQWAPRSTAHKWLGIWSEQGVINDIKRALLTIADLAGLIDWERASVDGSFSPR